MRLVEDHDFVAAEGGVSHHFAQFADLVNAAIRCGVDLEPIERTPCGDFPAGIALVARCGRRAFDAIHRLGENSRRGGFSNAAHARKNVRMRYSVRFDSVFESLSDVTLAYNVSKSLRTPLARNDLVSHEEFFRRL